LAFQCAPDLPAADNAVAAGAAVEACDESADRLALLGADVPESDRNHDEGQRLTPVAAGQSAAKQAEPARAEGADPRDAPVVAKYCYHCDFCGRGANFVRQSFLQGRHDPCAPAANKRRHRGPRTSWHWT